MATGKEIEGCFEALRNEIQKTTDEHAKKYHTILETSGGNRQDDMARAALDEMATYSKFVFMGLFILESFVLDVKRIAVANERIASCEEEKLIHMKGSWSGGK